MPGTGWPSASQFNDTTFWPVIHVTQSTSLPIRGRGMIIADSNFSISGSDMWSGILLVGGQLVSNGNNVTYGTTMSGLNWLLGGTPPAGTIDDATANGQKSYVYDSCSVAQASQRLRHFVAMATRGSTTSPDIEDGQRRARRYARRRFAGVVSLADDNGRVSMTRPLCIAHRCVYSLLRTTRFA